MGEFSGCGLWRWLDGVGGGAEDEDVVGVGGSAEEVGRVHGLEVGGGVVGAEGEEAEAGLEGVAVFAGVEEVSEVVEGD